jgi:penicillin-binding protein 1A
LSIISNFSKVKFPSHKPFKYSPLIFAKWIIAAGLWCFALLSIYVLYVYHDLPDISGLEQLKKERKVTILDSNGNILANFGDLYGRYLNYYEIPRDLRNAVIATEDRRFFEHHGVDPMGIVRAAYTNFKAGHTVQGGSTITQQLAKIVFLTPKRTLKRKVQEALLAIQLERKYTKQQLFAIYLNRVYMGTGIYGIDSASKYYFGKNVKNLNLYESAILAGLLKAPSRFSPTNNSELSGQRAYQVLLNMFDAGFISKQQVEEASNNPVNIETRMFGSIRRHYFTSWVYDQVPKYTTDEENDIVVKTTLNLKFQKITEKVLNNQLAKISEERKVEQGAVVILDHNAKIIAMVGGKDFGTSPFNRATQAKRQAGSAFKLFVYAAAMEDGFIPSDKMMDAPVAFGTWRPKNFHNEFLGLISIEEAFKKSINTVAVRLIHKVGVEKVIKMAEALGIKEKIEPNLSIALGTTSITLLELAGAYAAISNGGMYNEPYTIQYIRKANDGKFLYVKPYIEPVRAMREDAAYNMDRILTETVRSGTAKKAHSDFKIAGKTGTSQDFRDSWFAGYTNKYVIGVWLGNDDYSPTKAVSGGTYPTIIARDILNTIQPFES